MTDAVAAHDRIPEIALEWHRTGRGAWPAHPAPATLDCLVYVTAVTAGTVTLI